ncbi:MAG: hypothetical protein JKY42_10675 [Flavobacteriales bacterium]|nr:hypothetical protein [Flavobacteriales bacterium]
MKWLLSFSVLFFSVHVLVGQSSFTLQSYDSDSNKVNAGIYGEIQYNSSAITNEFAQAFYQGEYLTDDIKRITTDRMTDFGRLGLDINYGVYTSLRLNKFFGRNPYRLNWFLGVFNREHTDLSIPKYLFKLVFEGNKQFAGQTIDIGGFNFNLYQYQQIQAGLFFDNGLGQKIAVSASYLNGNKYLSYSVPDLNFYTSEIGDEISVDWNFQHHQSNGENIGYTVPNGYGFSTDLMYQFSYSSESDEDSYMKLEINDLGFINWSVESKTITSSDSVFYDGYHIKDIQEIHDSVLQDLTVDSIVGRYTYSKTGKFTTYLPTRISVNIRQQHSEKLAMNLGISYRINANYTPYLFFEEHFSLNPNIDIAGRLSYGGYSQLSVGINVRATFNTLGLFLGSNNIEGLVAAKQFGGFSAFGGITVQL